MAKYGHTVFLVSSFVTFVTQWSCRAFRLAFSRVEFDISKLYPDVSFPVSRGTPSIAPLASWAHDEVRYYFFTHAKCRPVKIFYTPAILKIHESGREIEVMVVRLNRRVLR